MNNYEEITAKEARETALQVNEKIIDDLKCVIMSKIHTARSNGEFYIQIKCYGKPFEYLNRMYIGDRIVEWLEGLGYEIESKEDYKTDIMVINFGNAEED